MEDTQQTTGSESGAEVGQPTAAKLKMATAVPGTSGHYVRIIVLAVVLILAGAVIIHSRIAIEMPRSGDTTGWATIARVMLLIGAILVDVGALLFVITGLLISLTGKGLSEGIRRGSLLASAIVLLAWLWFITGIVNVMYVLTYPYP